jgi:hydroxyethylthiazole kinase-like sugar kinase family protein
MSTTTAFAVIPHGGPAIAIVVGCILSAVIAAMVAMETKRRALLWAVAAFVAALLVLSVGVDLLTV